MLKVWGRGSVANVQKVLWCLGELGVPFDHFDHGADPADPRDRAYLACKTAEAVPILDDDGFVLWEGNAIARYLAAKYGSGTLWPDDPRERADAERWMDYQLSTVRVHLHPLMRETPKAHEVAYHTRMLAETMKVVEATLADSEYLVGSRFTVGDIPLGIVTYRWMVLDIERPQMPNIEAWYGRLARRPAFRRWMAPPEGAFTRARRA